MVLVLYGLSVGKTRALVSLLAIYVAYALTVLFPFLGFVRTHVPGRFEPLTAAGLFLLLYAITFLILSYSMLRTRFTLGEIAIVHVIIISVIQIGLLASMSVSLVPPSLAQQWFGVVLPYIAGQRALWIWAVISLLIVPFMKVSHRD